MQSESREQPPWQGGDVVREERGRARAGPTVSPSPATGAGPSTEHQQIHRGAAGTSSSGGDGSRDGGSGTGPARGDPPRMPHHLARAGPHQPKGGRGQEAARVASTWPKARVQDRGGETRPRTAQGKGGEAGLKAIAPVKQGGTGKSPRGIRPRCPALLGRVALGAVPDAHPAARAAAWHAASTSSISNCPPSLTGSTSGARQPPGSSASLICEPPASRTAGTGQHGPWVHVLQPRRDPGHARPRCRPWGGGAGLIPRHGRLVPGCAGRSRGAGWLCSLPRPPLPSARGCMYLDGPPEPAGCQVSSQRLLGRLPTGLRIPQLRPLGRLLATGRRNRMKRNKRKEGRKNGEEKGEVEGRGGEKSGKGSRENKTCKSKNMTGAARVCDCGGHSRSTIPAAPQSGPCGDTVGLHPPGHAHTHPPAMELGSSPAPGTS